MSKTATQNIVSYIKSINLNARTTATDEYICGYCVKDFPIELCSLEDLKCLEKMKNPKIALLVSRYINYMQYNELDIQELEHTLKTLSIELDGLYTITDGNYTFYQSKNGKEVIGTHKSILIPRITKILDIINQNSTYKYVAPHTTTQQYVYPIIGGLIGGLISFFVTSSLALEVRALLFVISMILIFLFCIVLNPPKNELISSILT